MKCKSVSLVLTMVAFSFATVFVACKKDDDDNQPAPNAWAVSSNELLSFNLSSPGSVTSKTITNLQTGEVILGIDIRPQNGQLYALGSTSRLYTIDKTSGVATAVGTTAFSPVLSGANFGFDFNPMVDRVRVISNTGQNFRLNPETGVVAGTDITITPGTPAVSAAAYSNNSAGATTTVLYVIDPSTDKLYKIDSPNNGVLTEIGSLGIDVDGNNGFDIGGTDNKAYALLNTGAVTKLYSINLSTGAATAIGNFQITTKGLAVLPGL